MPDLHELLAREASRGGPVSAPPFETLVARSRQRRVKQALAVTAAVVAVTAAVAVPLIVRGSGSAVVAGPAITTTDAAARAAAQQVVNQMVADVKLPAGASPLATPPAPLASEGPTKDTVTAERFFTVAGTMDSVIAYVTAHPPAGLVENGTSTETSGTQRCHSRDARCQLHWYGDLQLRSAGALGCCRTARRRGCSAGGRAGDVAARAHNRRIGACECRCSHSDLPPKRRRGPQYSWESPQAQVLAGALNALYTQGSDITDSGCATSNPVYTVTFEVSHQPLVFTDYGCGFIAVTAGGVSQPALETGSVESRLFSMLGLQPAPQSSAPPNGSVPPGASSPAP